jgi:hypothetical protein
MTPTITDPTDILKILLALQPQTPGRMPQASFPPLAGLAAQRGLIVSPEMLRMLSPHGSSPRPR